MKGKWLIGVSLVLTLAVLVAAQCGGAAPAQPAAAESKPAESAAAPAAQPASSEAASQQAESSAVAEKPAESAPAEAAASSESKASEAPAPAATANQKYIVVTHGPPANPFWAIAVRGATDAGKQLGVEVQYLAPDKFSVEALVSLIDSAIAAKPDGIAVSITDPKAVAEPIQRAVEAGIPVIAINVADPDKKIPYLFYIGADEYTGGFQAGQRMLKEANGQIKRAGCAIHEVGNVALETRCKGFTEAMKAGNVTVDELDLSSDQATAAEVFKAYFAKYPEANAMITLGPDGMSAWAAFAKESGIKAYHATFDLDPIALDAIRSGVTLFAIDQQQYLQGYMGVEWLYLKHNYEMQPANDIFTGPGFVDKNNIEKIAALIEAGYR
jgi:simple sugar transport system substrate-binding protein